MEIHPAQVHAPCLGMHGSTYRNAPCVWMHPYSGCNLHGEHAQRYALHRDALCTGVHGECV